MGYYAMNDEIKEDCGNVCNICEEEINNTYPFYFMGSTDKLAHASCYWEEIEKNQEIDTIR